AQVLQIGRETAEGLAAAHERGLIHRDIKPANIFLATVRSVSAADQTPTDPTRWKVKLLDFGLVSAADNVHLTRTGYILGTPAYMAQDKARDEVIDHGADLFSLGCILYRLCAGELPFQGTSTMAQMVALMIHTPRPLRDLNPTVPPALADLIMR